MAAQEEDDGIRKGVNGLIVDQMVLSGLIHLFGNSVMGIPTIKLAAGVSQCIKMTVVGGLGGWAVIKLPSMLYPHSRIRQDVNRAFAKGGIFLTKKQRDWVSGTISDVRIFPNITRVSKQGTSTTVLFTLPIGLDPRLLETNQYVFQQILGEAIELERISAKEYRLIIMQPIPSHVHYDYSAIEPMLEKFDGLPVYVGISYSDQQVVINMGEKPHIGMVGVTGWGKSTGLRVLICTWIQYLSPSDLELYLADLKMTEFGMFRDVPHVKKVSVSKPEVLEMLENVYVELVRRQRLLHEAGALDTGHYFQLSGKKIPFMVVCIDEVALLQNETRVHEILNGIGAIGRSMGVFLVLSQQRVDRNVMDGGLRNNINIRIAYRMSNGMNSQMFLDDACASEISYKGRCFVKEGHQLHEVQTPLLTSEKAKVIIADTILKYPPKPRAESKQPRQGNDCTYGFFDYNELEKFLDKLKDQEEEE